MKKLLTAFVCGLFLTVGASHANAAYFADWDFNFDMSISAIPSEYVFAESDGSISWLSGNNLSNLSIQSNDALGMFDNAITSTSLIMGSQSEPYQLPTSSFLGHTVTQSKEANTSEMPMYLANLAFSYSATAPNGQSLNLSYNIPLKSFYDASSNTSYLYYSLSEVSARGSSAMQYEGEFVRFSGAGLLFNDAIENIFLGDFDTHAGWSFSATEETPPAPTPEPATMLLTGLGLAGLGYMKRRRNKA